MRQLSNPFVYLTALYLAVALALASCAGVSPKGVTQDLYAAGWTLVGATNAVADLHDSGTLTGANYAKAKDLLAQSEAAYKGARTALSGGNTVDAAGYIRIAQSVLNQLAAYLAAREAK